MNLEIHLYIYRFSAFVYLAICAKKKMIEEITAKYYIWYAWKIDKTDVVFYIIRKARNKKKKKQNWNV